MSCTTGGKQGTAVEYHEGVQKRTKRKKINVIAVRKEADRLGNA